jgi:DNA-binding transcriptional MerR regulator
MEKKKYVPAKVVKEILNITDETLRVWTNEKKISYVQEKEGGHKKYDLDSFLESNLHKAKERSDLEVFNAFISSFDEIRRRFNSYKKKTKKIKDKNNTSELNFKTEKELKKHIQSLAEEFFKKDKKKLNAFFDYIVIDYE